MSLLSEERRRLLAQRLKEKQVALGTAQTSLPSLPSLSSLAARRDRSRPAPLSFSQQRLWVLDQIEPGDPFYNVGTAVELRGPLDPEVLARCFGEIVRRHEALRTVFGEAGGVPFQVVAEMPPGGWPLAVVDLAGVEKDGKDGKDIKDEALRLAREEGARPFDLARGPLVRTVLLRLAADCHLLLLTQHHIVSDGWSNLIFLREMAALYEAFAAGRPSPLGELAIQYADFAEWQRAELQGERLAAELAFWRQALDGAPEALELPLDRPRPPLQTYRGAHRPLRISPEQAVAVRRLAKQNGATPFMVLLAVFGTLLRRVTGQTDLLVGTPVANRRRREIEGLIGFFVNTLVLRIEAIGDPAFRALLERLRDQAHAAYAHQDLPFERLIEELRPERDPSRPVLFQVMFSLDESPAPEIDLPGTGLRLRVVDLPTGTAKFDLTLSLTERDGGFSGAVEFNADLFDAPTAARWAEQYQVLLAGALADPGLELSGLPVLTAPERHQILHEWNDTECAQETPGTVLDWIAERARETPEAPAIDGRDGRVSYRELRLRALDLAARLRSLGVGPEARVGIGLPRSAEALVSILGVLESGGAFVPLDPDEPRERLAFLLEDSGVKVVIVDSGDHRAASTFGFGYGSSACPVGAQFIAPAAVRTEKRTVLAEERTVLTGRTDAGAMNCAPTTDAERPGTEDRWRRAVVHPDQAAYVLYTSGSTGRPKGAVVSHRALATFAGAIARRFDIQPSDRVLQFAPLSFDVCLEEIFPAWIRGGAVVVDDPHRLASVAELGKAVAGWRVTVAELPTAFWREWEGHLLASGERPPACLRLLVEGGEKAPAEPVALWRSWGVPVANAYGLTETTVTTIVFGGEPGPRPELPIGRPVDGSWVGVLGPFPEPAPAGTAGEIAIGGAAVARGYLGRPALTAERFVPDPWSGGTGARLYRTGDLARWLPDGNLEFLGRIDHQVKVRGFRVETGEIEAALAEHPAVRQAAVLAPEGAGTSRRLVAYVAGEGLEAGRLREHLRARVPEFMVPSFFVLLPALPLTSRGKIDRRALPAPDAGAAAAGPPPRTPVEQTLAAIWADALGLGDGHQPGRDDDFFELGGHSLLATRVISRVRSAFAVELPLRTLFEAPTLAGLAGRIEGAMGSGGAPDMPETPPIVPRGLRRAPLSFAQQRLWFLDRLRPGSALYNLPLAVKLRGELDPAALAAALAAIVLRHETLRTTFSQGFGAPEPEQVVAEGREEPFPLPVVDLAGLEAPGAEARRLVEEEARTPFDLGRGPVLRVRLVRLAAQEHLLALTLHHIAGDGWSLEILIREIGILYEAAVTGRPSPLPALPVQYADFAVWQREHLRGEALESQLRFWREELAGVPTVLELPADRPRGDGTRGAQRHRDLPPELAAALRALSRRRGATLFMTLLAGFEALLQRSTGEDLFLVGTPIAGRNRAETEGLIGFFVNTLALRADLTAPEPGGIRFGALLERTRTTALAAYAHQDLPFERLVEELELRGKRHDARQPLFQTVFALENASAEPPHPAGLRLEPLATDNGGAKWDLLLSATDAADTAGPRVALTWEFLAGRFDPATIDRLGARFERLLAGAVADPEAPVSALPLLSAGEEEQLRAWNRTDAPYPREATIHGLFAEQARRTPDAVALEHRDERISYGELAARARRLAARFSRAGLGPEGIAVLLLDRSPEAIVAILATLEAGGAYLPLDPTHPPERLAWMLADSRAAVLVTHGGLLAEHPWATAAGIPFVRVDEPSEDRTAAPARVYPESLAYVMYTSGSTGTPKGVAVTHRNVVRLVRGADYAELGPDETFLQLAPLAFDASTLEIWGPLLNGGRLVLFPGRRAALDDLAAVIAAHGVTSLWLTAGLFHQMVEHRLDGLRPLRQLLAGGDVLAPSAVRRVLEELPGPAPGLSLINGYGPTEGTTFTCCHRVTEAGDSVPIGRPIANTRVHVLDRELRPVPAGVAGELYAGGDGLARGYFGQPGRTAERFVPDPLGAPGERLYRTGDRVRWRPDGGVLEFLGRLDRQVKVRGIRVEPGEVEAALAGHPAVRDAAVIALRQADGSHALVAFVAPRAGGADLGDLASWLRRRLPEPFIPAHWEVAADLPLTANGKLDRSSLAALAQTAVAAGAGPRQEVPYVPPRTAMEGLLVETCADLLGLDAARVSLRANFFDLGGHSLLASQLAVRLRDRWGIEVPLQEVFEAPDLGALADAILEREIAALEGEDLDALLGDLRPAG